MRMMRHSITLSSKPLQLPSYILPDNALQDAANYTAKWCDDNNMSLNTTRSHAIMFTLKKSINPTTSTIINNSDIEEMNMVKLLGITYDQHMRFGVHVSSILARSISACNALSQQKEGDCSYKLSSQFLSTTSSTSTSTTHSDQFSP